MIVTVKWIVSAFLLSSVGFNTVHGREARTCTRADLNRSVSCVTAESFRMIHPSPPQAGWVIRKNLGFSSCACLPRPSWRIHRSLATWLIIQWQRVRACSLIVLIFGSDVDPYLVCSYSVAFSQSSITQCISWSWLIHRFLEPTLVCWERLVTALWIMRTCMCKPLSPRGGCTA